MVRAGGQKMAAATFRHDERLRRARSFISLALDARNAAAHFAGEMEARAALRYLDAMRELLAAVGAAGREAAALAALYDEQLAADGGAEVGDGGLGGSGGEPVIGLQTKFRRRQDPHHAGALPPRRGGRGRLPAGGRYRPDRWVTDWTG